MAKVLKAVDDPEARGLFRDVYRRLNLLESQLAGLVSNSVVSTDVTVDSNPPATWDNGTYYGQIKVYSRGAGLGHIWYGWGKDSNDTEGWIAFLRFPSVV